jgi:hypothetical protein
VGKEVTVDTGARTGARFEVRSLLGYRCGIVAVLGLGLPLLGEVVEDLTEEADAPRDDSAFLG